MIVGANRFNEKNEDRKLKPLAHVWSAFPWIPRLKNAMTIQISNTL